MAAGGVPPGGDGATKVLFGAWCLAVLDARQAVWDQILPSGVRYVPDNFGAVMVRKENSYTTLGDVHDAMLWLGVQLQVHLVLG